MRYLDFGRVWDEFILLFCCQITTHEKWINSISLGEILNFHEKIPDCDYNPGSYNLDQDVGCVLINENITSHSRKDDFAVKHLSFWTQTFPTW